ncbi:MAG: AhpC/TSA family protein, partial [Oscillospiraceae bacterium]
RVVVALQSDREALARQLGSADAFPFQIICDPQRVLYERFAILPAVSQMDMFGPKLMEKMAQVQAQGIEHGAYEGDEMQLPAAFAVDEAGKLIYVHYAQGLGDIPDATEIAALLS